MSKLTVGSLFAGIGGIDIAFEQAGFKTKWANENDKYACQTFRKNFPNTKLFEMDIKRLESAYLDNVDIITSGFPCQAFSVLTFQPLHYENDFIFI